MFAKPLSSVNGIYMMYCALYIPSTLFVHYPLSQKFGNRGIIITGTILTLLSVWLRLGINSQSAFTAIFFSNIFSAIGMTCFINEIPKITSLWFSSDEVFLHLLIII